MTDNLDWKKKAVTIQPQNCQCLPQVFKLVVGNAIAEQNRNFASEIESNEEAMKKYPAMSKRASKLLNDNPQYQQGLVTAVDLGIVMTPELVAALKESIDLNNHILEELDNIPNCEGRPPIKDLELTMKDTQSGRTLRFGRLAWNDEYDTLTFGNGRLRQSLDNLEISSITQFSEPMPYDSKKAEENY